MFNPLINKGSSYYAGVDAISQLQETSAVAPLVQTQDSIATWATSATGPLSDHNLLVNTGQLLTSPADSSSTIMSNTAFGNVDAYSNCIAIGDNAMNSSVGGFAINDSICIGPEAGGNYSGNEQNNVIIGSYCNSQGQGASNQQSVMIGSVCCEQSNDVGNSVCIGPYACQSTIDVATSVVIGDQAGMFLHNSATNVIIGQKAVWSVSSPASVTGLTNSVIIGQNACSGSLANGANDIISIGYNSGNAITTNHQCLYLDNPGTAGENNAIRVGVAGNYNKCFISGIRGVTTGSSDAIAVLIDSTGQLGTVSSSIKYKENINDLLDSDIIYKLRPVQFNYKNQSKVSLGLIAEEVEQVYPDMCIYQPNEETGEKELLTVDYQRLTILLLAQVKELNERLSIIEPKILYRTRIDE